MEKLKRKIQKKNSPQVWESVASLFRKGMKLEVVDKMRISQVKKQQHTCYQFSLQWPTKAIVKKGCTLYICLRIKTLRKTSEHLKSQQQKN